MFSSRKHYYDGLGEKDLNELKKPLYAQTRRIREGYIVFALALWACYVRLWRIDQPNSVVFDEVHFGGFASKYIKREFFMDVHPPLAKMMIALVAKLAGFDGSFDFKEIGKEYTEVNVPYVAIRAFCGLLGAAVVPFAYITLRTYNHSMTTSVLTSLMLCYENGLITNNRHILLDSPLLFFTAFTTLSWSLTQKQRPFGPQWHFWLGMTGLGLGCTVSSKWVGLFTIALIGVSTLMQLWKLWGTVHIPIATIIYQVLIRFVLLAVLPLLVYIASFRIHFWILSKSGSGDTFMSIEFQQSLQGASPMEDTAADVMYGSQVWIRHVTTRGGYLHSHPHDYKTGSQQQQITLYPYKDDNNWWIIEKEKSTEHGIDKLEPLRDGDIIRLRHRASGKRLHSHDHKPPVSDDYDYHKEVSAYGYIQLDDDPNDLWRVQVISDDSGDDDTEDEQPKRVKAMGSKFRLLHPKMNCALFSHDIKLPKDWGFGQQEVTCIQNGKLPKTLWYIENTFHEHLPSDAPRVGYKVPGFFSKFMELNKVMWDVNNGLTGSHAFDSRPDAWPLLARGIYFWGTQGRHIYLLGNPIVFWLAALSLTSFFAFKVIILCLARHWRKGIAQHESAALFFAIGWCMHYFPFFLMQRQLFLHHYMPAFYFSVLLFGTLFDVVCTKVGSADAGIVSLCVLRRYTAYLAISIACVVIYIYHCFIPITYGEPWTREACVNGQWRSTWDFDCKL
ncbi:glycosyltransferase family 39 protein [Syncephalastrum racemosum]|uniref:Dolichyl-phosphate-mannose--protein mannosyltransferase n=1 Tax=Syncephalastrum racemosum TaxID=13706 RepID=A0A1X2HNQ6_SYNRA|nr:glycosyltransferase family 39 protein [Syncephalastrum racemosum]